MIVSFFFFFQLYSIKVPVLPGWWISTTNFKEIYDIYLLCQDSFPIYCLCFDFTSLDLTLLTGNCQLGCIEELLVTLARLGSLVLIVFYMLCIFLSSLYCWQWRLLLPLIISSRQFKGRHLAYWFKSCLGYPGLSPGSSDSIFLLICILEDAKSSGLITTTHMG